MPELPDIETYVHCLRERLVDQTLRRIAIHGPSILRTVEPEPQSLNGLRVVGTRRVGKRIVIEFDGEHFAVIHLMIAGRLTWHSGEQSAKPGVGLHRSRPQRLPLVMTFEVGTVSLQETAKKHRATLHIVNGEAALDALNPHGLEPLTSTFDEFDQRLRSRNHTLKRALTNPHLFSGIGNAFSDEILHAAKCSPLTWTTRVSPEQSRFLFDACRSVLVSWTERLIERHRKRFPRPSEVTAFRPEFAVHGKFGEPCPVCGAKVQRIRYAERETNYCPVCQTDGVVLADRSMSRLLKDDWPRRPEEWE